MRTDGRLATLLAKAKGELYLFGSVLKCDAPNDVDILIAYGEAAITPGTVAATFRPILTEICAQFQLPAHVLALSHSELDQTDFFGETCELILTLRS
jgi:hypothetical protein